VRQIADRYTVLRDGKNVATGEISTISDDELIAKMVGRSHQTLFPDRKREPGEVILKVEPGVASAVKVQA
jgi:ABC-type sugar transport system ATPase subunit